MDVRHTGHSASVKQRRAGAVHSARHTGQVGPVSSMGGEIVASREALRDRGYAELGEAPRRAVVATLRVRCLTTRSVPNLIVYPLNVWGDVVNRPADRRDLLQGRRRQVHCEPRACAKARGSRPPRRAV